MPLSRSESTHGSSDSHRQHIRAIEQLDLVNETLPASYHSIQSRVELRTELDRRFAELGMPPLSEFIEDARQIVAGWKDGAEEP